jgi:hypothetical protein
VQERDRLLFRAGSRYKSARRVKSRLVLLAFAVICLAAACDRSHPYDGAPNYSGPECVDAGGRVEAPSGADGGFQMLVDQGCPHVFLGYAVIQGQQTAIVGLCCSM